ncbi:hypothetical protein COX86_04320 [Candidatus Micrarchaeota archaeon CG_4_10_14_0_2_um_filter_60_11]|nr:MAG: hypothetical protein AUJ16_04400 [Candidatus Micrarchaeota archaeon CG1_02_60_51]PIN95926.1 MAG: hypothetical protein COU39_03490 [Candidatus Micrarchaeota archaeon CG10_big_fil_rev_8_21_14_0_10_60_32]PIO02112.1 MAG: hypothetical protein COT58_01710 [Candidatus Micrarchaeota archaeon CG09_land_8_20_14_0_10_60_16]PIY91334.1 MAG: hypothetical protein COY71_03720 [Candidatus Micrarchaeota archaeon CG_4_10_14_0_8_um_filter_60_7]PIZ90569.1 MAG: hypothetical protein COX86_04320 [Candidatus Mi
MDLLSIVAQPNWREFLTDLVASEGMDPWDIDLMQIADKYLETVRAMQAMDLRVPANVILASALLLRFKAESLKVDGWAVDAQEEFYEERQLIPEELPDLVLKPNRPRPRKVTLDELIEAMGEVMKRGRRLPVRQSRPTVLNVQLPQQAMNERMRKTMELASKIKDGEDVLLFSALLDAAGRQRGRIAFHLLPVMHLVQDERMLAWQDETFGEIFIRVLPETADGSETAAQTAQQSA